MSASRETSTSSIEEVEVSGLEVVGEDQVLDMNSRGQHGAIPNALAQVSEGEVWVLYAD